jgi:hypothetical protein
MATRNSYTFNEMPVATTGSSEAYSTSRIKDRMSLRLVSTDWSGVIKTKVKFSNEATYHDLYTDTFSDGGSVIHDLPHAYSAVELEVTTHTSGTVPTAILSGWRE